MAAVSMVPYEGLNYLQNANFKNGTQIATFYAGLITNVSHVPALGDTMVATHASFSEPATAFGTTRPTLSLGSVSNGVVSSSANVEFTNSSGSTVTVYGYFIGSSSTVGATTGTLVAEYLFASPIAVIAAAVLSLPITLTAANG